jgi:hypothetical protein
MLMTLAGTTSWQTARDWWATRLGLDVDDRGRRSEWTRDRVLDAISDFVKERFSYGDDAFRDRVVAVLED